MNTTLRTIKNTLIAAAVVALMTGATAQARAENKTSDLHYVAVGVSKMPLLPPTHQLAYPHKDAQDMAAVWQAQKGKLYQNVSGETLTDTTATLPDILAALDRLVANAKRGDTAVISLAGHGGVDRILNQWIFEPSNADPKDYDNTVLTETQLRKRMSQLTAKGVNVILVLDTCQSGAFTSGQSGIVVLAACTATQGSRDDRRVGNGLFTCALIEALNGKADTNRDGIVTIEEIQIYVAARVAELTNLYPVFINGQRLEQTPTCHYAAGLQSTMPVAGVAAPTQESGIADRIR